MYLTFKNYWLKIKSVGRKTVKTHGEKRVVPVRIIPVLECYYVLGWAVPFLHTWAVTVPFIPWFMGKA